MVMPVAIPLAIVAAGVAGAAISSNASKSAAETQAAAAGNATQTQWNEYQQTRADQAPWRDAGSQAVGQLSNITNGNISATDYAKLIQGLPGYQFQMDQGNQAVQRDLAARGLLNSGAAGKALTQYGQGVASNYSNQYMNYLQSLAGLGQTATQATSAAGTNAANQVGANDIYAGNARASGYVGQANAINAGLSGLVGAYGQYASTQSPYAYGSPSGGYGTDVTPQYTGQYDPNAGQNYLDMIGNP
jgi:hypothetical protein